MFYISLEDAKWGKLTLDQPNEKKEGEKRELPREPRKRILQLLFRERRKKVVEIANRREIQKGSENSDCIWKSLISLPF